MSLLSSIPALWCILAVTLFALVRRCFRKHRSKSDRNFRLRRLIAACLLLACTTVTTEAVTYSVKQATGRLRPFQELAGTRYLDKGVWVQRLHGEPVLHKKGNSFISGHASNSMALATTLAYLVPPLRLFVYILPFSVGYSRVYLGKHYPSDVFVGWIMGWLIASAICRTFQRRFRAGRLKSVAHRKLIEA